MIKAPEHLSYKKNMRPETVQPGEDSEGDLINVYKYLNGGHVEDRPSLFLEGRPSLFSAMPSDSTRGNGHKLYTGGSV